jgi:fructose-bisphosphate aldolase class II
MLVNLNAVLHKAQKEHFAVGLFNTVDTDLLEAVISAAEEMNSPVIIGTAQILLPYGEMSLIAPSVIAAAKRAKVPVVVHYDHGLTYERCIEALELGFSSIMFDGSERDYDANIAETKELARVAHAMGATIEGEIGHVGEVIANDEMKSDMYTTPEEAASYAKATGVDALAVAIGTAHGEYKTKPCLDLNRLAAIRAAVDTPLVLHGGSGLSDDDFRNTIKAGVAKINIFTDLCVTGEKAMKDAINAGNSYLDIRNIKVARVKEAVKNKIMLFGSQGKA